MAVSASSAPTSFACPGCGHALAPESLGRDHETSCPGCRALLSGSLLPAFWSPEKASATMADHAFDGDAVCFFHPENRATLSCDRCGRFVCTVCDMPLGVRHLCPTCLSSGLGVEKLPELVVRRFHWANATFLAGLVPLLIGLICWPFFIATGPLTLFCGFFGWKRPGSLPRGRRRWLAVLGLLLGGIQLVIWIGAFLALTHSAQWRNAFR